MRCVFSLAVSMSLSLVLTAGSALIGSGDIMPSYAAPYDDGATGSTLDQMRSMAKPFKKQEVNKGRVWLLFVLGASSLFGVTVLVENNSAWFPAIYRANKAMKASMKAMEEKEKEMMTMNSGGGEFVEESNMVQSGASYSSSSTTEEAVLAGIRQASAEAKGTLAAMKSVPEEIGVMDDDVLGMEDTSSTRESEVEEEEEQEEQENVEDRKPLFEISGDDIDRSMESRLQMESDMDSETTNAASGNSAFGGVGTKIDLSAISLEDLEKELQKRQQG